MSGISQYENSAVGQIKSVFKEVRLIGQGSYDIGLPLPLGILYVRVEFSQGFPNIAPMLKVASRVSHSIISSNQVIEYPEKRNWNPRISVVSVLQNIHRIFSSSPPQPIPESTLPNFNELLKNWDGPMEDESDISDFLFTVPDVSQLAKERDELLQKNLSKAEENIKKKQQYKNAVEQHSDEILEIENLSGQLGNLMKEVEAVQKKHSLENVIDKLKDMENNLSKEASEISKKLTRKEINIEEFTEQYQGVMKRIKFIQLAKEAK